MPAHTTHAKIFMSHNPTLFPKNLSHANLIHSRKFYIAQSDTFSQKSIAHESNLLI
jgi:hypothetical protein